MNDGARQDMENRLQHIALERMLRDLYLSRQWEDKGNGNFEFLGKAERHPTGGGCSGLGSVDNPQRPASTIV
jgi:hypothetical protein